MQFKPLWARPSDWCSIICTMIGSIKGNVTYKGATFLIIEAHGVGYKTYVPSAILNLAREGKEIALWTYMAVRENALDLYGFGTKEELNFFELMVNSVSGIGPKSAMAILSIATLPNLRRAISTGDITHLIKVSGIGKKNAEKIVIELKDKLEGLVGGTGQSMKGDVDALEALKSLGYGEREIREALKKVSDTEDTGEKVKKALKLLS